MATVTIQYFGMDGVGKTVTEAKRDAGAKIEKVLAGYYTPTILKVGELIGFIWREPSGYCYKIIRPEDQGEVRAYGCSMGERDEKETIRACARHMAQNMGSYAGLEKYLDAADRRELDQYAAWQSRFRKARHAGYDEDQARQLADQGTVCA